MSTPKERADQFKNVSLEVFAGLIDNINREFGLLIR